MNVIDYLEQELAPFSEKAFSPVDSVALSQMTMVRMGHVVPPLKDRQSLVDQAGWVLSQVFLPPTMRGVHFSDMMRAEYFKDMFTGLDPRTVQQVLFRLAASPRFREMTIQDYASLTDEELETQFAAVTFVQPGQFAYVGFRGTDSWVGWRENFNQAFMWPVPAQDLAKRYLETVAAQVKEPLIVGGHSKGGNLAVYAAAKAAPEVRDRITAVYNHDGPGFMPESLSDAELAAIAGINHKTVPQESIVGLLMNFGQPYRVVQSDAKGIAAHSVNTWQVDVEKGDFVYVDDVTQGAKDTNKAMTDWVLGFSLEDRRKLVNAFFAAVEASDANTVADFFSGDLVPFIKIVQGSTALDDETRNFLLGALGSLGGEYAKIAAGHGIQAAKQALQSAASAAAGIAAERKK